ncbi:MAG: SpoVR family protein, partial [Bdellovibrionales bacterium]
IEDRWNKGRYGRDWEQCDDVRERKNWDKKTNQGRDKIFQVRKVHNDVTFIDEFLTEDFCVRNKMFVYKHDKKTNRWVVDTRDFKAIKSKLLFMMTNFGQPIIKIEDANFENRGELLLTHVHEGIDMQPDFMTETLKNVFKVWSRPVNLVTVMDGDGHLYRFDGQEFSDRKISSGPSQSESTADTNKKP